MIPVTRQAEPSNFDRNVRQPGQRYLASNPNPTFKERRSRCWTRASDDLYEAYNGTCAYSCFYFLRPYASVDHFLPKKYYPHLAYEWDNYRLASPRMNNHKGESEEVIDPFIVQTGWFVLEFPSCLVKAGYGLSRLLTDKINKTVEALKLNDDDTLVQERCNMMLSFADGEVNLSFLQKRFPFLASEIVRQGIESTTHKLFKRRKPGP